MLIANCVSVYNIVKKTRMQYIENKIEENKNDSKKLWKTLKSLGYNNKVKVKCNEMMVF